MNASALLANEADMKSPVVVLHNDTTDNLLEMLIEDHQDLNFHACNSYGELESTITRTGAEVVYSIRFGGGQLFPRKALLESKTLKWVAVGGSGTDHLAPWDASKITVTNSAGAGADMMAEFALGGMLHFCLKMPQLLAAKGRREWTVQRLEPIGGKTVLIIGLGKVGQAVAHKSKLLGLMTLGIRADPKRTAFVDEVRAPGELSALWPRADFVVCSVPLLKTTEGMVNGSAFERMKSSAVLIDMSRGGVVDETSLIDALERRMIRGAVLDVFKKEPLESDHPFWGFENVVISPHCSSTHDDWWNESIRLFSKNLTRYRKGEPLANVVDPDKGY